MIEISEEENITQTKKDRYSFVLTPKLGKISFILGSIMIIECIVLLFTWGFLAQLYDKIPSTILYAFVALLGIAGTIFGVISNRKKATLYGILGVIFSILSCLWNVWGLVILYCEALYILPF